MLKCHYAEGHSLIIVMLSIVMFNLVNSYVECSYVECSYAECRYAECRGAIILLARVLYQQRSGHFKLDFFS